MFSFNFFPAPWEIVSHRQFCNKLVMTEVKVDNYLLRCFTSLYNIKTIDKNQQHLYYQNHNYSIQCVYFKLKLIICENALNWQIVTYHFGGAVQMDFLCCERYESTHQFIQLVRKIYFHVYFFSSICHFLRWNYSHQTRQRLFFILRNNSKCFWFPQQTLKYIFFISLCILKLLYGKNPNLYFLVFSMSTR